MCGMQRRGWMYRSSERAHPLEFDVKFDVVGLRLLVWLPRGCPVAVPRYVHSRLTGSTVAVLE